jgi:beta-glucosidase
MFRLATLAVVAVAVALLAGAAGSRAAAAHAVDAACPWMDATKSPNQRARLLLAASTLDQKLRWLDEQAANNPTQLTFTVPGFLGGGTAAYDSVQVPCTPIIQYTDGPWGVDSGATGVTAFPVPIAQTASWDAGLSREKGKAQASEAFQKHRNVLLAPGLNLARTPLNGRDSEYMGEDPLLAGALAASWMQGLQKDNPGQPVEAVLKHYVANDQETDRQLSSSNVDARTLHELYDVPFEIAVARGHPGGVMCAYDQVNSVYSCENPTILSQYLKREIGFDGWVVSDFGAVHSTVPSLTAGLDQELNAPLFYAPEKLKAALAAGQITEAQIDDAALRVVRAHIAAGLFDHLLPAAETPGSVSSDADRDVALRMAEEGTVLLKNQGGSLPLAGHGTRIAVIGPTASNTPTNGVSAQTVCSAKGFFGSAPVVDCPSPVAPLDAITARAAANGDSVTFSDGSDTAAAAATARAADVAIVFGYYTEGEGTDRPNIDLDNGGDALVSAVAAANPNTVVVLETGSAVLMPWLDQVRAVLEAWYPGVEQGAALAALLFGDVNPSGKLPVTFPRSTSDLPTRTPQQYPGVFADGSTTRPAGDRTSIRQVSYSEGLDMGYRWYDSQGIQPAFPFGFGLSYTSFQYRGVIATPPIFGLPAHVLFTVRNTGSRAGTEVAQVYLGLPAGLGEPPKRLAGFARVTLAPGQLKVVDVQIDPASPAHPFSYWNGSWTTAPGFYRVYVGGSERDTPLTATIALRGR